MSREIGRKADPDPHSLCWGSIMITGEYLSASVVAALVSAAARGQGVRNAQEARMLTSESRPHRGMSLGLAGMS
jgi:hypothetical protein